MGGRVENAGEREREGEGKVLGPPDDTHLEPGGVGIDVQVVQGYGAEIELCELPSRELHPYVQGEGLSEIGVDSPAEGKGSAAEVDVSNALFYGRALWVALREF